MTPVLAEFALDQRGKRLYVLYVTARRRIALTRGGKWEDEAMRAGNGVR